MLMQSRTLTHVVPKQFYSGESITFEEIHRLRGLADHVSLPSDLFDELESFAQRNSIIGEGAGLEAIQICMRCLKAHIIVKVNELHISQNSALFLIGHFHSKTGHNGYYLDNAKVKEIN